MSIFHKIDNHLHLLAGKLNAKLSKDRPGAPQALRTFEERRIDWEEGQIHKAIIIQPTFKATGVDCSLWSVINIAWHDTALGKRIKWRRHLVYEDKFEVIESSVVQLLSESENNLRNIRLEDLKP